MKTKINKDGKFGTKLSLGILPLISIVIFLFGQGADVLSDSQMFGIEDIGYRQEKFADGYLDKLISMSKGENVLEVLIRNLLMYTTLTNLAASAFFINSAINNNKEGQGKFDNYKIGVIVMSGIFFIVVSYNGSLLITDAISHMKGYTYISGFFEHSIVQIVMILYFLVGYKKDSVSLDKKSILKLTGGSILYIYGYQVFFTILGGILVAANALPVFGDMSSNGYFPYDYLDFSSNNVRVNVSFMTPVSQYISAYIAFAIVTAIGLGLSLPIINKQNKKVA